MLDKLKAVAMNKYVWLACAAGGLMLAMAYC